MHRKPRNLKKLGLAGPKKLPESSSKAKEEVNNDLVEQGLASCGKTWDGKLTDGLLHKHLQLHPRQKEIMELGRTYADFVLRAEVRHCLAAGIPLQDLNKHLGRGRVPSFREESILPAFHSGRKAGQRLFSHMGFHSC